MAVNNISITKEAHQKTSVDAHQQIQKMSPVCLASFIRGLADGSKEQREPLFDVINEHGEMLMIGVSHAQAAGAVDAYQTCLDAPPQWQCDMRIRRQRTH